MIIIIVITIMIIIIVISIIYDDYYDDDVRGWSWANLPVAPSPYVKTLPGTWWTVHTPH